MGVAELLLKRKQELAAKNTSQGEIYRNNFANETDVVKLQSGVLYKIMEQGSGILPDVTSKVRCHYHGTNIYGEVFDSSVERGKPADFQISKLIQGWQEVMPLLNVGSKAKIVIPPDAAYGDQQLSKKIGPFSTLIFEVELLEVL